MTIKKVFSQSIILILASFFIVTTAWGHSAWLENRQDEVVVVYGHGPMDDSYAPEKVTKAVGYGNSGEALQVEIKEPKGGYVPLGLAEGTALVALTFDNGFWSKDAKGKWHNLPKSNVEGAQQGGHYVKYNLTVVDTFTALPDSFDQPLVIIPQSNPLELHSGDAFRIRVLFNGQPLAKAKVKGDFVNHDSLISAITDDEGYATITIANQGLNVITVGKDEVLKDNPDADKRSIMSTLAFTLKGSH